MAFKKLTKELMKRRAMKKKKFKKVRVIKFKKKR